MTESWHGCLDRTSGTSGPAPPGTAQSGQGDPCKSQQCPALGLHHCPGETIPVADRPCSGSFSFFVRPGPPRSLMMVPQVTLAKEPTTLLALRHEASLQAGLFYGVSTTAAGSAKARLAGPSAPRLPAPASTGAQPAGLRSTPPQRSVSRTQPVPYLPLLPTPV